uniref:Immunoglobulin V-set domain-containing protein n=1 Tax=Sinocyclocheilus anshuiensis TaxID=1608454 RepID=A0A671RWB2_9TELE
LGVSGESLSDQVHQNPPHLITKAEKTVQLSCSHTINGYRIILWYQQLKGNSALNLIGYVNYNAPTTEDQYKNQFSIGGNGAESSTINITLKREHVGTTAIYYCAASKAQC